MSYLKFGFHEASHGIGVPDSFFDALDEAGIPFFAKAVDKVPLHAQAVAKGSSVGHTVVFRRTSGVHGDQGYDVPDYFLSPREAAVAHWAKHVAEFPVELDKDVTWVETINEVDRNRSEWLADFSIETARLALEGGYRYAAFGWATGEPDVAHWEGERMLAFLRLCADYPDRLAVALHEYSLDIENVWAGRDEAGKHWLVGRVEHLFEVCDRHGIGRPTVLITEWGWQAFDARMGQEAMDDYWSVGEFYARYPQIKGAAVWYLGNGWEGINQKVAQHIDPVLEMTLNHSFPPVDPPPPDEGHKVVVFKLAQEHGREAWEAVGGLAHDDFKRTQTASHNDLVTMLLAGNGESYAVVVDPLFPSQRETIAILDRLGLGYELLSLTDKPFVFTHWPTTVYGVTQWFARNREAYEPLGLCYHEGIDLVAPYGEPYYAVGNGRVVWVSDQRRSGGASAYGWHVIVDHGEGLTTLYAHARPHPPVEVGQVVAGGEVIAYSGNTGNSSGPHCHLTVKRVGVDGGCLPDGYVDPWPLLRPVYDRWLSENGIDGYVWANGVDVGNDEGHGRAVNVLNIRQAPYSGAVLLGRLGVSGLACLKGSVVGSGYYPVVVVADEGAVPPPVERIDLLSFFKADPSAWRVVRHPDGREEDFRDYDYGDGHWVMAKNGLGEWWFEDGVYIYLKEDTSPADADDGTARFYRVNPGRYARRFMGVGEVYADGGHWVQFYDKGTCLEHDQNSGSSSNNTAVVALHKDYTFNQYGQNLTLDEVLFVQGNSEVQIFARHRGVSLGRVGWQAGWGTSEIVALYFDRPPLDSPPVRYCVP